MRRVILKPEIDDFECKSFIFIIINKYLIIYRHNEMHCDQNIKIVLSFPKALVLTEQLFIQFHSFFIVQKKSIKKILFTFQEKRFKFAKEDQQQTNIFFCYIL